MVDGVSDETYQIVVKENDDGELYIELPWHLMEALEWDENTSLEWRVGEDGSILLGNTDDSGN